MADAINIDLAAIEKEVEALAHSGKLEEEYLKLRTRQKKQQKKQQGSGAMKLYQQRKKTKEKLIRELIEKKGLAEKLDAHAEKQAEAELEAESAENETETEESVA